VNLLLFPDFVNGMQSLSKTTRGRRRSTIVATWVLLLAAVLYIDSQSLVGDGASLHLIMVEARRLFFV
jgi:hypothetical protein